MTTYYDAAVLADTPLRYYTCSDASGSLADSSGNGQAAVKTSGTPTYAQAALLNSEASTSLGLNGAYFTVPTAGFPTGADAGGFAMEMVTKAGTVPSSFKGLMSFGTQVSGEAFNLGIDNTGKFYCQLKGLIGSDVVTAVLGTTYYLGLNWDGTTLTLYVNGVSQGTSTGSTPNLIIGAATIGAFSDGSGPPSAWFAQKVAFYGHGLSAARWLAHYDAGIATLASGAVAVPVALSGGPQFEVIGSVASPVALSGNPKLEIVGSVAAPVALAGNPRLWAVGSVLAPVALAGAPHLRAQGHVAVPVTLGNGQPRFEGAITLAATDAPQVVTVPTTRPYVAEEVTP